MQPAGIYSLIYTDLQSILLCKALRQKWGIKERLFLLEIKKKEYW
jgi:hypothetical protein